MLNVANGIRSYVKTSSWTLLFVLLLAGCSTSLEEQPALLVDGEDAGVSAQGSLTVSGELVVSVRSALPISEVAYYLDDAQEPWEVVTERPFEMILDTTELEDGEHVLTALADINGNVTESEPRPFTVKNSSGDSGAPPDDDTGEDLPSDTPQGDTISRMLELVNEARGSGYRCFDKQYDPTTPLSLDARLSSAAQKHAEFLTSLPPDELSHTGRGGSSVGDRISAEGYVSSGYAENIASGYPTPEAVVQGWLSSTTGHCNNIMSPAYEEIGLAVAGDDSLRWVQVFAIPQ